MINFNQYCNQTECLLTEWSLPPIIGTMAAICKLALGTVQTITALMLGILSAPFRCCSENAAVFNDHCWSHVVHGLGNMAASIPEGIPILSSILFTHRIVGHSDNNPEHQDKYIPYADLVAHDLALEGGIARRYHLDTSRPSDFSPTTFRNYIGINTIPLPQIY